MQAYTMILFLHVLGALGLFFGLGLEAVGHRELGRARTAEKALEWMSLQHLLRWVYPPSTVGLLVTGLYLGTSWGAQAWILVGLGSLIAIALIGGLFTGRRMRPLAQATAQESGPISTALERRLRDPILRLSLYVRIAVATGVVFLMTVKPGLGGSLGAIAFAGVVGVATSLSRRSPHRSNSDRATIADRNELVRQR